MDDDPMMLNATTRVLSEHDVVCARDAREVVVALLGRGERFDVIVSDLVMPHMTGIELYEQLLARDPEAARRMVFVSAGAADARIADFLAVTNATCLRRPIAIDALRALVQDRLAWKTHY